MKRWRGPGRRPRECELEANLKDDEECERCEDSDEWDERELCDGCE